MKKKLIVVGEKEEVIGYKLAGVKDTIYLNDPDLKEKISTSDSIIFVTKKAKENLGNLFEEIKKETLIQEIPDSSEEYTNISKIIQDTVGFDLRK